MLIPNHPDDERLSALASHETDATADAKLTAHVSACDRCTGLVQELGALRAALADLPDLRPSRPLQLVPPVETVATVDRLGGWARRFFAPVLASGAALALAGTIGTAAPALNNMAVPEGGDSTGQQEAAVEAGASDSAAGAAPSDGGLQPALGAGGEGETRDSGKPGTSFEGEAFATDDVQSAGTDSPSGETGGAQGEAARASLETERSPWPMVLFAGVALIVAAGLMRWILAPRAG